MKHRRLIFLLFALVAVIVLVVVRGIDWRPERTIQIGFRILPAAAPGAVEPLVFLLDRQRQLTAVSVFRESEIRTNKYALAVWELVAEGTSTPLTHFHYGAVIHGLKTRYPGVGAEKLTPATRYRIMVESGRLRGQRDFDFHAASPGR